MYKIYDKVYILHNNQIQKKVVYAVTEKMNFMKTGTETFYLLVNSQVGACDENSIRRTEDEMFDTPEEVTEYLLDH
jgi:hypothetical protein